MNHIVFLPKTSPCLRGEEFNPRRLIYKASNRLLAPIFPQIKSYFLSPEIPTEGQIRFAMRQIETYYNKDGIKKYSSPNPLIEIADDISKSANNYRNMNEQAAVNTYIYNRSDLISDISFGVVFFNRGTDYFRRSDNEIDLILKNINSAAQEPQILPRRRMAVAISYF